jgi:hypothetical protein
MDLLAARRHSRTYGVSRVYWYTWASDYRGPIFDFTGLYRYSGHGKLRAMPQLRAYRASARRHQGCRKNTRGTCRRHSR